jgi:hypothetical protein
MMEEARQERTHITCQSTVKQVQFYWPWPRPSAPSLYRKLRQVLADLGQDRSGAEGLRQISLASSLERLLVVAA